METSTTWPSVPVEYSGVFLLDSKRWTGSVTVDGDSAVVRRIEGPGSDWRFTSPAPVKCQAAQGSEAIRASTCATVWVIPVIVVWGDFAQVVAGDTCKFVHGDALAGWLKDQTGENRPSPCGTDR